MQILTITIPSPLDLATDRATHQAADRAKDQAPVTIRPVVSTALAQVAAAVKAGACAWRQGGQPWQPLCPMVDQALPGDYKLSAVFLEAIAAPVADRAELKQRLTGLCARLGVEPAAMTQPVAALSRRQLHQLTCALAILSPRPDIVILPGATWLSLVDWAELAAEFALGRKVLWPFRQAGAGAGAGLSLDAALNLGAALSEAVAATIDAATTTRPGRAQSGAEPRAEPRAEPQLAAEPQPGALTPSSAETSAETLAEPITRGHGKTIADSQHSAKVQTGAITEPQLSAEPQPGALTQSSAESEAEPQLSAEPNAAMTAEPQPGALTQSSAEPQTRAETRAEPITRGHGKTIADSQHSAKVQTGAITEPQLSAEPQPGALTQSSAESEAEPQLSAEPPAGRDTTAETSPEPLPAGLTWATVKELPAELRGLLASEADDEAVLWLKGPSAAPKPCAAPKPSTAAQGEEPGARGSEEPRVSYDLSAALQGQTRPKGGWRIAISTPADVVWGCLSKRRLPLVPGGRVAISSAVRWRQMTTSPQPPWQWLVAGGAGLELTRIGPDFAGQYDQFVCPAGPAGGHELSATFVEYAAQPAKTYHNHPSPAQESWRHLSAGSEWLRLSPQAPAMAPAGQALHPTDLVLSPGQPRSVGPILALLTSHGIAEPWDHLLAVLTPTLRQRLPMEYYVDLLALLSSSHSS